MTVLAKLRARAGLNDRPAPPKAIPPHGTLIAFHGRLTGWVAPLHWQAKIEPGTGKLLAMFYHGEA